MTVRAKGANASLLCGFEPGYGQVATTAYALHFSNFAGGDEIALEDSDLLGTGRDPVEPDDGPIKNEPSIDVPVDLREIGFWLSLLLGMPTTTGDGPYTHSWSSGADDLPSATLSIGYADIGKYFHQLGFKAGSMAIDWSSSGKAKATIAGIAQTEAKAVAPLVAAPAALAFKRFSPRHGFVKLENTFVGNLVSGKLSYSNSLDAVRTVRNDGLIEDADPSRVVIGGEIRVRFSADSLLAAADSRTTLQDLSFGYERGATEKLIFTLHQVHLPKPKKQVNGPAGIEATYAIKAAKSESVGRAMSVTLVNDVETYILG